MSHTCKDEEANEHPCRACNERFPASVVLDELELISFQSRDVPKEVHT